MNVKRMSIIVGASLVLGVGVATLAWGVEDVMTDSHGGAIEVSPSPSVSPSETVAPEPEPSVAPVVEVKPIESAPEVVPTEPVAELGRNDPAPFVTDPTTGEMVPAGPIDPALNLPPQDVGPTPAPSIPAFE